MAADRWFGDIRRAIPQQRDDGIEIFILAGGGFAVSRRSLLLALGLSKRGPQRGAERLATFIETLDAGSSDGIRLASALRHPFLLRAANAGPTAHAYAADLVLDMSRLCRTASKSSDTSASARELANRIDVLASRLEESFKLRVDN